MGSGVLKPAKASSRRGDGRLPLMVYLEPKLIQDLKGLALEENAYAYELVEQAVRDLISVKRSGKTGKTAA